ncbi:DNA adenine methylase [Microbulbifer sp. EKSA008]|uniref:DNA adenine methylase n=1 Tax=Microbulbifer sp. EKSA008 TaxID=3243367 RepID=UPI004041AB3C
MIKPFLKWAGGKRWFVHKHSSLIPQEFNRYIEPFLGSGAVYFHVEPERAILGDLNQDLVDTYIALRENWSLVLRYLRRHHNFHCKEYYYQVRSEKPRSIYTRAARFIYLNRTCWNGLYRVNLKGEFNVPIGTKSSVIFPDDQFEEVSLMLQGAELFHTDFEALVDEAGRGDLLFVDPPYTVKHNLNGFVKYNEKLFSWCDQERLLMALERARRRGAQVLATNAYHESVRNLYQDNFQLIEANRTSTISGDVSKRDSFEELIIYSGG